VEYTFKNSLSGEPTTVVLGEYSLSWFTEGKERLIPYANILSVQLSRSGKKFYTSIKPSDQPEIRITSISVTGEEAGGSQYATFIRVLHYHLREKSMAYYVCGNNLPGILYTSCASVIISFGLSHSISKLSFYQSNLVALILTFLSITVIAIVNRGQFPNVYKPENIPSQFLPYA
jgi:hypothetical protein